MKSLSTYAAYFIASLSVIGCGGGEEAEGSSPPPPPAPPPPEITTGDLVSNTTFEFHVGYQLTINLSGMAADGIDYHVNVCSQFQKQGGVYKVDHQSCRLRAIFSDTAQEFIVSLGADETELIAQIWPIMDNATPVNLFWEQATHGDTWQVEHPDQ
jgi:hypothetical protein